MITMLKFGPMGNLAANCYLVETDTGFILIDTARKHRKILERELLRFTGDLTRIHLIILTHGDFDHAGNAAWLMKTYGIPVAMHVGDADMVRTGDMLTGRGISSGVFRWLAKALFSPETFTPSLLLEHGDHLGAYGFNAEVISLPGHSSGSIGILTSRGDLFCGDLYTNRGKPALNRLVADRAAFQASHRMVQDLPVKRIFPGHGRPFTYLPAGIQ